MLYPFCFLFQKSLSRTSAPFLLMNYFTSFYNTKRRATQGGREIRNARARGLHTEGLREPGCRHLCTVVSSSLSLFLGFVRKNKEREKRWAGGREQTMEKVSWLSASSPLPAHVYDDHVAAQAPVCSSLLFLKLDGKVADT